MIKIDDKEDEVEEINEEEITHKKAIKALIYLAVIVVASFVFISSVDIYNNHIRNRAVKATVHNIDNAFNKGQPIEINQLESYEYDLNNYKTDNPPNKDLLHQIDILLDKLDSYPTFVVTGKNIKSWATSELIKTEIDTLVVPYKERYNYNIIDVYQPVTPIEIRAFDINRAHPDWSKEECIKLANRKIWVGMSKLQLQISWGNPKSIDRHSTFGSDTEQWIYGNLGPYVYINNGSVTSWQE